MCCDQLAVGCVGGVGVGGWGGCWGVGRGRGGKRERTRDVTE